MNQIKVFLLHELAELPVYRQILRFEWAAHEINLMADNPGSIEPVIVIAIGWSVIVSRIMDFVSHALQNMYVI